MYPRASPSCKTKKKVDYDRLATLSLPSNRSPNFIPDRPSVYWLDFILDETALKITDPQELRNYYNKFTVKAPRLKELSRPKTVVDACPVPRPTTAYGVPLSALYYEPSDRIKCLSTPKESRKTSPLPLYKTGDGRRSKTASKVRIGDNRSASSLPTSKRVRSTSTKPDLSKGDFHRRSKYRLQDRSSSRESGPPSSSQSQRRNRNGDMRMGEGVHQGYRRGRQQKDGLPSSSGSQSSRTPTTVIKSPPSYAPVSGRPPVPNSPEGFYQRQSNKPSDIGSVSSGNGNTGRNTHPQNEGNSYSNRPKKNNSTEQSSSRSALGDYQNRSQTSQQKRTNSRNFKDGDKTQKKRPFK